MIKDVVFVEAIAEVMKRDQKETMNNAQPREMVELAPVKKIWK